MIEGKSASTLTGVLALALLVVLARSGHKTLMSVIGIRKLLA